MNFNKAKYEKAYGTFEQLDISDLKHGTPADLRKRAMLFVRANK